MKVTCPSPCSLRCGTAWEIRPTSVISTVFGGPLALATHMAPGTQQVPELTGYLLYLFPEFGFAPHIIEPGWGSWIQFQHAWVFPYQQAVLSCQQGVQGFNSILTLSTWRQSPIPQVKGSVPQDHPPTGCCLKLACYLYF